MFTSHISSVDEKYQVSVQKRGYFVKTTARGFAFREKIEDPWSNSGATRWRWRN